MTALEIACTAMVSKRTVNRLAAKLFPMKARNGHMSTFSKEEALLLVSELRIQGKTMMGPRQSVAAPGQNVAVDVEGQNAPVTSVTRSKLPNGAQLHEIRLLAEKKILTADQVADAMGIPRANSHRAQLPAPTEARASHEQIAAELRSLIPVAGKAVTKADEAANMARGRVIAKETSRIVQDRMNFRLPLGGAS